VIYHYREEDSAEDVHNNSKCLSVNKKKKSGKKLSNVWFILVFISWQYEVITAGVL